MTEDVARRGGEVTREDRRRLTGGPGLTVWMTGLSGSGKSTIARALEFELVGEGRAAYVLDGDDVRHGLNCDLGFSRIDRAENIRRLGQIARIFADAGWVVIVSAISPYAEDRTRVRRAHEDDGIGFVEVYIDTPLEICEQRDPKGLYAMARRGEIKELTGIDDPYEAPTEPDVHIQTVYVSPVDAVSAVLGRVRPDM